MKNVSDIGVCAVVVTYNPDFSVIDRELNSLAGQVDRILIIDNYSTNGFRDWMLTIQLSILEVIYLNQNKGLGCAYNIGIRWASEHACKFILLLDQDSKPAPNMIEKLVAACEQKRRHGVKVAAVGPRFVDSRADNPPPFIRIVGLSLRRWTCDNPDDVVPVDYIISSGSLIPIETLHVVGGMAEELFIDYVDIEWGLRAQAKGYASFGVCCAKMHHTLGDPPKRFWGKMLPMHSPLRHYYHVRNAVWLYRQSWVPWNWKVVDCYKMILKFIFYSIFAKPRHKHFWAMSQGAWHGLCGRLGRLDAFR